MKKKADELAAVSPCALKQLALLLCPTQMLEARLEALLCHSWHSRKLMSHAMSRSSALQQQAPILCPAQLLQAKKLSCIVLLLGAAYELINYPIYSCI